MPHPFAQSHPLQQALGARHGGGVRTPVRQEGQQHVLERGTLRQQLVVLKHEPDFPIPEAGQFEARHGERVASHHTNLSAGGRLECPQNMQQGTFPGPGRTQDGQRSSPLDFQVNRIENAQCLAPGGGEFLGEVVGENHRIGAGNGHLSSISRILISRSSGLYGLGMTCRPCSAMNSVWSESVL